MLKEQDYKTWHIQCLVVASIFLYFWNKRTFYSTLKQNIHRTKEVNPGGKIFLVMYKTYQPENSNQKAQFGLLMALGHFLLFTLPEEVRLQQNSLLKLQRNLWLSLWYKSISLRVRRLVATFRYEIHSRYRLNNL